MTRSLLAIDSGHPLCTTAAVRGERIIGVGVMTPDGADANPRLRYDRVIVEIPTVRGAATPNPEDLLLIAVSGARLAERWARHSADIREVRPAQWKGNTPKPAHHLRTLWPALDAAERALLGGARTLKAIDAACRRGAADRWQKPGARYYRASELPTVNGIKITHDLLDAAALALYALGRIRKG